MVEGCVTDLTLGKEEAACLRWLGHLDFDHHPDAVACRLKLSLASAPCPEMSNVLPWDLVAQVGRSAGRWKAGKVVVYGYRLYIHWIPTVYPLVLGWC